MRTRTLHACALTLSLLAATEASAQVYLSDYLGTSGCYTLVSNPPYVTSVIPGLYAIGIDTPGSLACEPIRVAGRKVHLKGVGMAPQLFGEAAVEFDLDAIRQVNSQPIDVFEATVGLHTGGGDGARFDVYLDDILRERVDILGLTDVRTIRIPVTQASTLRLETSRLLSLNNNFAVWGDAKLMASESAILGWGENGVGQRNVPAAPSITQLAAGVNHSLSLRSDGSVVSWGDNTVGQCDVPAIPAGRRIKQVAAGGGHSYGLLDDGTVLAWGDNTWNQLNVSSLQSGQGYRRVVAGERMGLGLVNNGTIRSWGDYSTGQPVSVPALPPSLKYVDVRAGTYHAMALRSDGEAIAWGGNFTGQTNVPALPVGTTYVEIACGYRHSLARRSDGVLVAVGDNNNGQLNVPALPAGVTYVEIDAAFDHSIARRSDGTVIAWGSNLDGQLDVPPLPNGMSYTEVDANGGRSIARRDDGAVLSWGTNFAGVSDVPDDLVPSFVQVRGGEGHALALLSHGWITAWGDNTHGELDVPPLPFGATYTAMDAGLWHSLALRSDGEIVAWGDNSGGQLNVPLLPAGVTYVDVAAGRFHSLALRSDGVAVGWGANSAGEATVPVLAAGLSWVDIDADAGAFSSLGLVSDGSVRAWGFDNFGQVSQAPAGTGFVEIVTGVSSCMARRADGTVVHWGDSSNGVGALPPLPAGSAYEQLALGWYHGVARRDDGEVLTWGSNYAGQLDVGPPPEQSRYVEIAAGTANSYARIERRAVVETWGVGCAFEGAPSSIYEPFSAVQNADLAGTTITWQRISDGYNVVNSLPGTFVTPPAGATVVAGGQLDGQQQFALSSPMPAAGGTVTVLNVTTKGLIELGGQGSSAVDYTPTVAELLTNPRTVFACWHDFNQETLPGTISFHEAGGVAYATWDGVGSFFGTATDLNTLQFQFDLVTGDVQLVIEALSTSNLPLIVGYSQAGSSSNAIAVDLTQQVLIAPVFDNTPGLELSASGRPALGNASFALETTNVPSLLPVAFFEFGSTRLDPGIELSFLGMPGCYELVVDTVTITSATVTPGTSTATYSLPIPSNAGLIGAGFACQSLAFSQATQFNLITSNGLEFTINY